MEIMIFSKKKIGMIFFLRKKSEFQKVGWGGGKR
jgi:hypothetical protein